MNNHCEQLKKTSNDKAITNRMKKILKTQEKLQLCLKDIHSSYKNYLLIIAKNSIQSYKTQNSIALKPENIEWNAYNAMD
jgi:hypothetical protein